MIQSDSNNSCPRFSTVQPTAKALANAGLLGLLIFSSACQLPGRAVSLAPASGNNATNQAQPGITGASASQLVKSGQPLQKPDAETVSVLDSEELIAADLVNAMLQTEKLHPSRVTLQMNDRPETFSATLKFVLEQAGYNFSSFSTSADHLVVSVKSRDLERNRSGLYRRYQINVGEAKFRREYFMQPQGVTPSSDLMVKGVDASRIVLNEDIFEDSRRPVIQPTAVNAQNNRQVSIVPTPEAARTLPTVATPSAVREDSNTELPALATAAAITPQNDPDRNPGHDHDHGHDHAAHDSTLVKKNLFELGHSNFANITENYIDIRSQVLVFANDSLKLGRSNKAAVLALTEPFIEESDLISIIGCSHGRTSITNGNVVLATGRTQRVKEAFLIAGIAEDKILDEGCWSATGEVPAQHPSRGVTVTLKRERRNG